LIALGVTRLPAPAWRALSGARILIALKAPVIARTGHFVLQHLPAEFPRLQSPAAGSETGELSTDGAPPAYRLVDKCPRAVHEAGFVIPKRLARRAVTRNLIRRQMRAALTSRPAGPGIWLFRLVRAFEARQFVSAASLQLRAAIRRELDELMGQAGFA
jgi:ribonuclease P protein component